MRVRIDVHADRVVLSSPSFRSLKLRMQPRDIVMSNLTRFTKTMESRRPMGMPVSESDSWAFLAHAKRQALLLLGASVQNGFDQVAEFTGQISRLITLARVSPFAPFEVEIVEHDSPCLPWEWLGTRDRKGSLVEEAESILGYAAHIHRRFAHVTQTPRGASVLQNPLRLRYFRNARFAGATVEERLFRHRRDIHLVGPFPTDTDSFDSKNFSEQLANPFYPSKEDDAGAAMDQVVHISCHHESSVDPLTCSAAQLYQAESILSFGSNHEHDIALSDLQDDLQLQYRPSADLRKPIVFFNTCRGNHHPFLASSVTKVFLRNGNRGIISTAMNVPDVVAASFGRLFYQNLLDKRGATCATALKDARMQLLTRNVQYGSPLGLLYSYYGPANLTVQPASR